MLFTEILLALQRGISRLPNLQAFHHIGGPRRGPGGERKAPLVASAEAKLFVKQGKARRVFPLPSTRNLVFVKNPIRPKRRAPKVSKGRPESPLVASAEAKAPEKQKKKVKALSLAFHKKSVSCERFRPPAGGRGTFPARESTQRAPGASKGCMSHGRPRTPRC